MPHARRRRIKVGQLASPLKSMGALYGERLNLAVRICWLVVLAGFILFQLFHLLAYVRSFTTVVVGAIFFAYLIFPLIKRLNERMPLGSAIAVVYAGIVLVIGLALYFVVPALSTDTQQLLHNAPQLVKNAQAVLLDPRNPVTSHLPTGIRAYVVALPQTIEAHIGEISSKFFSTVVPVLISAVAIGALFVVIPVVAAYFLVEAEDIKRTFLGFIPEHRQPKAQKVIADLDHVVGGFLRGQIVVAAIIGTLVTLLLLGLHIAYAVLIGALAGILDVIPYVGAVAGWLPAFLIAIFTNGFESGLYVTIGIVVINQLEGHIIAPNVVSKSVELTPLSVILALILGGEIAGIPGLLFAVPVAGAIRVLVVNFRPPRATVAEAKPALWKSAKKRPLLIRVITAIRDARERAKEKGSKI